jgi:hypothetical protein
MQVEKSDYPTCECCFSTLYIETGDMDPNYVTGRLNLKPTSIQRKGESANRFSNRTNPLSGWSLSSEARVDSKDLRNHMDWLLDQIACQKAEMESLRRAGCVFRVWCYWLSKAGHGGPIISVSQIKRLAELELEIYLDVYFVGEPEFGSEVGAP